MSQDPKHQHLNAAIINDEHLASLLCSDAETLQPSLPGAAQLLWRHDALRRFEAEDRRARRAIWPARMAVAASVLAAVMAILAPILADAFSDSTLAQLTAWLPLAIASSISPAVLVVFFRARRSTR